MSFDNSDAPLDSFEKAKAQQRAMAARLPENVFQEVYVTDRRTDMTQHYDLGAVGAGIPFLTSVGESRRLKLDLKMPLEKTLSGYWLPGKSHNFCVGFDTQCYNANARPDVTAGRYYALPDCSDPEWLKNLQYNYCNDILPSVVYLLETWKLDQDIPKLNPSHHWQRQIRTTGIGCAKQYKCWFLSLDWVKRRDPVVVRLD